MIDHKLAVEHLGKHRKMVFATIGLLVLAFFESLYISCYREPSPLFCPLSWIYLGLAGVVLLVVFWYRK
jgi:hypothetical protein